MRIARFLVMVMLAVSSAATVQGGDAVERDAVGKAKALFNRYVKLEHTYDAAAADLYSDNAVIRNKRTYPTGQVRELSIPVSKYKELIRTTMPLAKGLGDRNTYSSCEYKEVGKKVRITCSRFSERKQYASPLTLLVGPGPDGDWQIFEELSESRP